MITDQKVVGLPGEEEKDQEGRGEAALHAEVQRVAEAAEAKN